MVQLGKFNRLEIQDVTHKGAYLEEDVHLPAAGVPAGAKKGDILDVFVYSDGEAYFATTTRPLAMVGEFAHLKVTSINELGAFLNWGLPKDLFLPYREQTREFRVGHYVVVYVYIDKSGRVCASMRTDRFLSPTPGNYHYGQCVDLFVVCETDLGFKAIINNRHVGVLYTNEIFELIGPGSRRKGYIKKFREDGKIDLQLTQSGHRAADDVGQRILDLLKEEDGFIEMNDKTSTDVIYQAFGVSKKKFKMALGGLLKKKVVAFEDNGIRLIN